MNDMTPIDEQSDLDRAKAKVASIEAKLAEAKAIHDRSFPHGASSIKQRESLAAITSIED